MVRNEEQYQKARALRQRGFSYAEIAHMCGCSKSTLSAWFAAEPFSASIAAANRKLAAKDNSKRISLFHKARKHERDKQVRSQLVTALTEFKHYQKNPAFIAGLMAYICCGSRTARGPIKLSSADPMVQRAFVLFAKDFLGVSRETFKIWLLLYDEHDEERCMRSWAKQLGLPLGAFYKNQFAKYSPQQPTLHDGILNTIIGSTVLKQKLLLWIELQRKSQKIK
jgi:transcriptional regulator with XRE-family HTH domain